MNDELPTPTTPGLYLGRKYVSDTYWNLLVYLYGVPPFMRMLAWDYKNNQTYIDDEMDVHDITFGKTVAYLPVSPYREMIRVKPVDDEST